MIGISVRTTNENGQATQDIPALWNRFMAEEIAKEIPNKADHSIYCIYSGYEKDHTRPYTATVGCRVENLDAIPHGMIGQTISEGKYSRHAVKGNISEGVVFSEWVKIWNSDLDRAYTADFEVYDERAQNPEHAEVDIFVAVR